MRVEDTAEAPSPIGMTGTAPAPGVEAMTVAEGSESPPAFEATTLYMYVVNAVSAVLLNVTTFSPVVPAVSQDVPPFSDRSIRYAVSPATSSQAMSMRDDETGVAVTLPGDAGADGGSPANTTSTK